MVARSQPIGVKLRPDSHLRVVKDARCTDAPIRLVIVRCPDCGKVLCEASQGSVVRAKCKNCRDFRTVEAA